MSKLRWQIIIVVLALIAIGGLLISQQHSSLPVIETLDEPIVGGTYSEALIGSIGRLNPLLDYYNPVDYEIDQLVYCSLVNFDHRGLPYGDLAENWGISQDGMVYNFSIRPEAYWHDGVPITSEDIEFTIDQIKNEEFPLPSDTRDVWNQVEVILLNQGTIQFRLPEPFSPFLDYLKIGILPKHLLGEMSPQSIIDSPFNFKPIGCGPYQVNLLDVTEEEIKSIELRAFDNYYGEKPYIETVKFHYFSDANSALAAYEQGEVMGINEITANILDRSLSEDNLQLFTARLPNLSLVYLNLDNTRVPFFQEVEVRRALMMSINRRKIIDRILGGQAIIAHSPIFPESWAYYDGVEQIEYDAERAIKILKDAGYTIPAEGGNVRSKDGVSFSFTMLHPNDKISTSVAESIGDDWKRLGIEVELVPVSSKQLVEDHLEPRTYQAALANLDFSRSPDPDPYPFWHQAQIKGGQNYSQWNDRQVSEFLEQARVIPDLNERAKRYRNFQVRFSSELPALPLFFPVYTFGIDKQVRGVSVGPIYDPSDRYNQISNWYLITGTTAQSLSQTTENP